VVLDLNVLLHHHQRIANHHFIIELFFIITIFKELAIILIIIKEIIIKVINISALKNSVNSVMINSGVMLVQNMDVSADLIDIHLDY